jgi:squalene-hopene/tetraprenyl-beta-curcumene cyclase
VQNRDGGIPTFCRGWGALPFDQSSPDLTAHAVRAWTAWLEMLPAPLHVRARQACHRAVEFLARSQRRDGSWSPLWFGNQFAPGDINLTYGTATVLRSLAVIEQKKFASTVTARLATKAVQWLVRSQNSDGGWGGAPGIRSSVEESALAVEALAAAQRWHGPEASAALLSGTNWLLDQIESGQWTQPSPIGFYFAKLWYYERLYPLIFTVGALKEISLSLGDSG